MGKHFEGISGWEALGFKSYNEYLESDFWRKKRLWIMECLGKKCMSCGSDKSLLVHHLNYKNIGNEGMGDLRILCWSCHEKEHGKDNS